jgi:hypothetical protein
MSFFKTTILAAACLIIVGYSADSAFPMSGWDPSWKQGGGQNGGTNGGGTRSVFEPSTALLVGSGIAGAAALRWIRSRRK